MDFSFFIPTRIIGGAGCVRNNAEVFCRMGKRALIITGASAAKKSGALDDVSDVLSGNKIEYAVFDEVKENPLLSVVAKAGRAAREFRADYIIAIGGGSVLDAARAASVFALNYFDPHEEIYKGEYTTHLPFVCIGTTAGTGSEVDNISVLTVDATGKKKSIRKDFLFADYTFCDWRYTMSMNLRQTVSTALDALCHCFESWFNTLATEPVAAAARRGSELIYPWLKNIALHGAGTFDPKNEEMRRDLYHGSLWGGVAITHAGTGFPHPAGYELTEAGGVPHGIACAVFETAFLQHTLPNLGTRDAEMLEIIIDNIDEMKNVFDVLCENDIALSQSMCSAVAERAAGSANMAKTLGGYTKDNILEETQKLFLTRDTQDIFSGGWKYGL